MRTMWARQAALAELEANPARPVAVIAAAAGVSTETVRRAMRELQIGVHIPERKPPRPKRDTLRGELANLLLAPMPAELARSGLCASHPEPDLWSSGAASRRQVAVSICQRCPVLAACAAYAASLPDRAKDSMIYAGQLPACHNGHVPAGKLAG